jgi:hypothetical protein
VRTSILVLLAISAINNTRFLAQTVTSASVKPVAAATTTATVKQDPETPVHLALSKTVPLNTTFTSLIGSPKCDGDGNFYLDGDDHGVTISKFNSKGKNVATFKAGSSPDVAQLDFAGMFTVNSDGELHQLAFPHSYDRDVFIYNKDGSYRSLVKLNGSKGWLPSLFVTLPSGNFMTTGRKWDRAAKDYVPFTGIFSSSGTLLKELHLEDDENIQRLASWGDSRFVSGPFSGNYAVDRGKMEMGTDGNVYLLRWLNPAVIYAISPEGEVVRRFTVDPGDLELTVRGMAIAGNRIAVVFQKSEPGEGTRRQTIEVVDLEGNKVAAYEQPVVDGHLAFGVILACYTRNPERFTFLGWTKDEKSVLNITEPR